MDIQLKSQPFTPLEISDLLNSNPKFLTGFTKEQLKEIKRQLRSGRLRRFAAIVDHQRLGFSYNALIAWTRQSLNKSLEHKLKEKDYISHIYLRKMHRLWPFGLWTMIHAQTQEELNLHIQELLKLIGRCKFKILNTLQEFKKTSFNPL